MNTLVEEKIVQSIVLEDVDEAARGALWLDEHVPKWYMYIDTATLDLASSRHCVIGQLDWELFDSHDTVHTMAGGYDYNLGFDINEEAQEGLTYHELRRAWIREIDKRKATHG